MKKFVTFVLALMVALSVCATSFATNECTGWIDTGAVEPERTCTAVGCGYAPWMSVMLGSKKQSRSCHSNDNGFRAWTEYRTVPDYGECC